MNVPGSQGAPTVAPPEPSDLATAIRVAQKMLSAFGDSTGFDAGAYAQANGGLVEALRILLRAHGAEPVAQAEPPSSVVRCQAAHEEDPTPCDGPPVVTVLDVHNAGVDGCAHHGARLLASLDGARVYGLPTAPAGTAIRVFQMADSTRPFAWYENAPRTRPEALSRAENRCGCCRWTFDPHDKRFDGHARHADTPFCRRCVDNCHEGSAEHVCVICDPNRYGGAR